MRKTTRLLTLADASALLTGALLYVGTGLHPIAVLTWLAPIPVLIASAYVSARRAALHAGFGMLIGQSGLFFYFKNQLETPVGVAVALLIYCALLFVGVTLLGRAWLRRRPLAALAAVPALWVTGEYATSLFMPHGAWWSLAYPQADLLPVVQIASATGVWGISFLIFFVSAAAAACFAPNADQIARIRIAAVLGGAMLLAGGYSAWRLSTATSPDAPSLRVGAAVATQPSYEVPADSDNGRRLASEYAQLVRRMAADGAQMVVLPEKAFLADPSTLAELEKPLIAVAEERHVDVILGVLLRQSGEPPENAAIALSGSGLRSDPYIKHHLIPGLEDGFKIGSKLAFLPETDPRVGIIICKDLDFPNLVRSFRNGGASVLAAPAWDFHIDGWLHSRMAVVRGVESGLAVVRDGRDGRLTVSDGTGHILAEKEALENEPATVIADVPTNTPRTFYARFGDWWPRLCAAVALLLIAGLFAPWRRARAKG